MNRAIVCATMMVTCLATTTFASGDVDKNTASEEKAINAVVDAWIAAHDKGDAEAMSQYYSVDADYVGIDGQVLKGRKAIAAMYATAFAQLPGNKAKVTRSSRRFLAADTVVDDGTWEVVGVLPEGAPKAGRYTTIFKKLDGQWRIICARTMVPVTRTAVRK